MGGSKSKSSLAEMRGRLSDRVGKISVSGRYHKLPKTLEDDYEICSKVLGSGYNGVVREAVGRFNKESKFAVKVFKMTNVTREQRMQLEQEVEIFLCMDHPHVARLCDVYESDKYLHLIMECMEGGELFARVAAIKRFTEQDAAEAVWQMLLALNYLHSHGIVHRDLKLENFLYDKKGGKHLKLIDFGFSKMWNPNIKMHLSCGTLSYVAPEVLARSYTSQCDLWSLGVVVFILLTGYMPFSGTEEDQTRQISEGAYKVKPEKWKSISKEAKHFTQSLLKVRPDERLTAETALEHPWIVNRHREEAPIDVQTVEALRQFGNASRFRRCCMEMMAWSLSNDERAQVRQHFIAMDADKKGTITLVELKQVLVDKFHIPEGEALQVFAALDSNNDEEIHYSDFLAAMVSTRIALHDDLLLSAFHKFDTDCSGYITVDNLREVLGDTFQGEEVENLLKEANQLENGQISYPEFVSYILGEPLEMHADAATKIIERELEKGKEATSTKGLPMMITKAMSLVHRISERSHERIEQQLRTEPACCSVC